MIKYEYTHLRLLVKISVAFCVIETEFNIEQSLVGVCFVFDYRYYISSKKSFQIGNKCSFTNYLTERSLNEANAFSEIKLLISSN